MKQSTVYDAALVTGIAALTYAFVKNSVAGALVGLAAGATALAVAPKDALKLKLYR